MLARYSPSRHHDQERAPRRSSPGRSPPMPQQDSPPDSNLPVRTSARRRRHRPRTSGHPNHHVPLICSLAPAPIVYKRNYIVRGDEFNTQEGGTIDFDVVTELVFPGRAAYLAWGAQSGRARLASRSPRTS